MLPWDFFKGGSMKLYIIRHGETVWNQQLRIQGDSDVELTDRGRWMAAQTGQGLKGVHFDAIYSSPLIRSYETATIIRGDRTLPIVKDMRLREMGFGVLEGKSFNDEESGAAKLFDDFYHDPVAYQPPKNGESFVSLCQRADNFMQDIVAKYTGDEHVMIVAHQGMNTALLRYIKGLPLEKFWSGELLRFCAVCVAQHKNGAFEMLQENTIYY